MRKITQIKKRVMAFALCAVMTLTSNVVVFAEGEVVPNVEESSVPVVEETLTPAVEETEIVSEESSEIVEESTEVVAVEAAEESVAATEESVVIAEESVAATEESVVIVEESIAATEESVVIAEESVAATEESVVIAEESIAATEEPVVSNEKVSATVESSVEATEKKTVETTEKTTATIDGSVVTTEDTIEIVLQILNYEDDDVKIHVEEVTEEAIPNGVSLKVTPITVEKDKDEYAAVEEKLQEKASEEEYEIAGFLAYDICFVDKDGNEIEPSGDVKVTMEYKEAVLPETVTEEVENLDVTVMHFEEDENGEVAEVVDMVETESIEAEVKTTENAEVEKAEFVTDSFSTYTITWRVNSKDYVLMANIVDESGNEIEGIEDIVISKKYGDDDAYIFANECEDITSGTTTYSFVKALITTSNFSSASDLYAMRFHDGNSGDRFQYRVNAYESWNNAYNIDDYTVYLVYKSSLSIQATIVDEDSNILTTTNIPLTEGTAYTLAGSASVEVNGTAYEYVSAYVLTGETKIPVTSVLYKDDTYYYVDAEETQVALGENGLYLVYEEDKLHTVETVDHSGTGIVMRMIDYTRPNDGTYNGGRGMFSLGGGYGDTQNSNWFNQGIKEGLVQRILGTDGYPVNSNVTNQPGRSLADAFEGGTTVNHLFLKSTYDSTGYYEYSSLENYAYLNPEGNFTVYEELGTPVDSGSATYYNRGNFFPYNQIVAGELSKCTNLYDVNGNSLTGGRAGEALYKTQGDTNYLFGMYLEVPFIQPKNGQVSSENMKYEFVGDDDLWIFIDNVLVLDIGGVHDARAGQINFATGDVTYDKELEDTTIKAMFQAAGIFPDGSTWDDSKVDDYFEGNTFADYSSHTMKMFYMERGEGASNLSVKFNIPPVEKESVTVKKEITNYAAGAYSDIEFTYKLYLLDENGNKNLVPEGTKYTYAKADGTTAEETVKADGTFVLKHNEQAVFNDLAEIGTRYIVEEIGISSETYDHVEITSTGVVNENDANISGNENSVSTRALEVGKDFLVLFKNTCAVSNMKHIVIEKELNGTSDDSYEMKVTVAGQPYTGKYKVGASYDEALASQLEYEATENGVITLKAGEVAVILGYVTRTDADGKVSYGIPSGTSFKVEEINLDQTKYNAPQYSVYTLGKTESTTSDDYEEKSVIVNGYEGYAQGTLILNANPVVRVDNEFMKDQDDPLIKVEKTFSGLTQEQIDLLANNFKITVTNANNEAVDLTLAQANSSIDLGEKGIKYTWLLEKYPAGTYTVIETGEAFDNHDVAITLNGKSVMSGESTTVTTAAATINYKATMREESCGTTAWNVGEVNLIVAKLTSNGGYFVWTREKASVSERMAIVDLINSNSGIHFSPAAELEKCYFYSRDISDTLTFKEGQITYDGQQYLTFSDSKQWSMFATGTYTVTDATSAEIAFTNTYVEQTVDIDIVKTTENGTEIDGARFALYKLIDGAWEFTGEVTAINNGEAEFVELAAGRYKLVETKAPDGFFILEDPVYFKVEGQVVSLTDADGNVLTTVPEMWTLDTNVLTVKNKVLYELPSTGGSGIHLYTIGGTVLMAGAALILYKNKRKEVL